MLKKIHANYVHLNFALHFQIEKKSNYFLFHKPKSISENNVPNRVSVLGVESLGGHFACLCRGLNFQKENGNTFTLFIIFIVKSLQKEQNSTNLPE